MPAHRVYLEQGARCVFAVSLDWPGWCRRAKNADLAIEELERYEKRFARIVSGTFKPGPISILGTVQGNATTDFGAPDALGPWDDKPATPAQRRQHIATLRACWDYIDKVVQKSSATLRRGPRGGGRDRDDVIEHVKDSERRYARKIGVILPPRTNWQEQREAILRTLERGARGTPWPQEYAIRRIAWHITDHAWEIEDKSE